MDYVVFIIPAYNASQTILRSISSILCQQGIDVSIVVVDHGSVDDTSQKVLSRFGNDRRVDLTRLERVQNELLSASRPLNVGFLKALDLTTKNEKAWLARLDADDVLATDNIIQTLLEEGERAKFISGLLIFYSTKESKAVIYGPRSENQNRKSLLCGGAYALAHHATLISPSLIYQVLEQDSYLYWESLAYGEDLELTLRLLSYTNDNDISFVEIPITLKFIGEGTISSSVRLRQIWKDHCLIFEKHRTLPRSLLIHLGLDLVIRKGGARLKKLREFVGLPAMQFGFEQETPYTPIIERVEHLDLIAEYKII